MVKIAVNKLNVLEFKAHTINEINDKDRYFNVYLNSRNTTNEIIAEVKINLENEEKSNFKLLKKGKLIHPKMLLAINKFISEYKR